MRRYFAPRWLLGHVVVAAVAIVFVRLGWWQWSHARQGNTLSYGYALQWPLFAGFGVFLWFRIIHERPRAPVRGDDDEPAVASNASGARLTPEPIGAVWSFRPDRIPAEVSETTSAAPAVEVGDELAAYNDVLDWLNADPRRRLVDYP